MSESRWDRVRERVAGLSGEAAGLAKEAGTEGLQIMAVTKTRPAEDVSAAYQGGIRLFGENRVQEFLQKKTAFDLPGMEVHLVGHLQKNKVKQITGAVSCIQSVDSVSLAAEIGRYSPAAGGQDILLEVNAGQDPNKFGFAPEQLERAVLEISRIRGVRIRGLMTVPPIGSEAVAGRAFQRLQKLFVDMDNKKIDNVDMRFLSMGMSDDYRTAIRCGSNLIRIGRAFFG